MNPISKLRFDSLAGYSRTPFLRLAVHELGWFEEADEKVLGMLALDLPDEDYDCFVLGRDRKGCFRAVWVDSSIPSAEEAYGRLETKLAEYARMLPEEFYQDDEVGRPLDFFTPVVRAENLNPRLRVLLSSRGASSARGLLAEMMHYFEDVDGNFVQQFQTAGFDARVWELYLYALLTEMGYAFNDEHTAPDFHCIGLLGEFFVEATTVNPSDRLPEAGESPTREYFEHVIPMRFGSALFSKLKKTHKGRRYWELQHAAGHPFTIAIQDFHAPGAMSWSSSALAEYLYGIRQTERTNADGSIEIISEQVDSYRWGGKEVPAGFFRQLETENISAVLANPEGTFSKFNRMGYTGRFRRPRHPHDSQRHLLLRFFDAAGVRRRSQLARLFGNVVRRTLRLSQPEGDDPTAHEGFAGRRPSHEPRRTHHESAAPIPPRRLDHTYHNSYLRTYS